MAIGKTAETPSQLHPSSNTFAPAPAKPAKQHKNSDTIEDHTEDSSTPVIRHYNKLRLHYSTNICVRITHSLFRAYNHIYTHSLSPALLHEHI